MARVALPARALPGLPRAWLLFDLVAVAVLAVAGARWALRAERGLLDFGSFWASGDAANHGLDPYAVYERTFRLGPDAVPAPNLNPPVSVYPFQLLARLEPALARDLWVAAGLAAFVLAVALLLRAYPREQTSAALWALGLAGLWHTLELGQVYLFLALAATVAWLLLRDRDDWRAGLALGLVAAVKPQFALWPLLLLLRRDWRAGGTGLLVAAALWAVPLALEGPGVYRSWLAATPGLLPANTWPGNSSFLALCGRLEVDEAALAMTGVAIAAAAAVTWRRRPARPCVSILALVLALLAGPITWPGYTLLLLPALFAHGWRRSLPAVLLLAVPYPLVLELDPRGGAVAVLAGSVYALGVLLFGGLALHPAIAARAAAVPRGRPGPARSQANA
ncbi:MAG: DUF2029 domain-containing protein [Dehalococcoidia bacterium]|nr:DUF2029 domain-containing protein [Dehalococcoidia bacterium]